jgi:hypothetical protein
MTEFAHQAATQADTYRQVNEGIHRASHERVEPFLCECLQDGCSELVELGVKQYEAVRADPRRFFVRSGHELDGVDEVVERHEGYLVVERAVEHKPRAG